VPTILLGRPRSSTINEAFRLIEAHRVSNIFTVPTILKMMVEHPAVDRYDHSSLRFIIYAGAPMYREDQKAALNKLGRVLVQYFGPRRSYRQHHGTAGQPARPRRQPHARIGTCGFERTGMQVSIQRDDGRELKAFETGEICVIGPAVFAGYYDNPRRQREGVSRRLVPHRRSRPQWMRRALSYITGRASDMYISGGSNIYPREVEEKILTHPAIGEVAVLGVPDPFWGEVGVAVCVAARRRRCAERGRAGGVPGAKVPRYKMPKRFFFWEALPKSGYGKIPKRLVRDELEARGLLDLTQGRSRNDRGEATYAPRPRRMRSHSATGPARAGAHPMDRGAGPRIFLHARSGPAAAGSRAPRLCRGRIFRRRLEHPRRRAWTLCLCDAGAVENWRQCRVLQRHVSAAGRHTAEVCGDDARRAATVRHSFTATACGPRPTGICMAAMSCPRRPPSVSHCGGGVR